MVIPTVAARSATVLTCLLLAVGLMSPVHAEPPVPLNRAGSLVGWGTGIAPGGAYVVPQELQGAACSKVVAGAGFSLVLTAAGTVVVMGRGYAPDVSMMQLPAELDDEPVVDIAAGGFSAAAVTAAGKVVAWGSRSELADATDVPDALTDVKAVAVGQATAAAVKGDGTVVAWGGERFQETAVPEDLSGVTSLAAGDNHYYALKADGTVVAWGSNSHGETALPAELAVPGNVQAVAARSSGGLALLADGSLRSWGLGATHPDVLNGVPESLRDKKVVQISALSNNNMALQEDGTITVWGLGIDQGAGLGMEELQEIPGELTGADIAGIAMGDEHALALVTNVLEVSRPRIAGTARVGSTLVATAAVFSGAPTIVASQWFADGAPIAGAVATSLPLTASHVGKQITFTSTASRTWGGPVVSASQATAAVGLMSSTVSVDTVSSAYGTSGRAMVEVTTAQGRQGFGTIQLTGAGPARSAMVSGGTATLRLDRALTPGHYTLRATYSGNSEMAASVGFAGLTVRRGRSNAPALTVTKTPTSSKTGKASLRVRAGSGLAKASGSATVTLRKGATIKNIGITLSGGRRLLSLPKLKKGVWKVRVTYRGDRNYVARASRWHTMEVAK